MTTAFKELQKIPWIGPAMAKDLIRLGIQSASDLKNKNAKALYEALIDMDGVHHDICVQDTFAAAIHFAKTGENKPWWKFSRERKGSGKPVS